MAFVNGFFYYCHRPVAAPQEAVGHPAREVWEELAASHLDIQARLATSATVFERKPWREDLERWDREVKPAAIRDHLELLAVDPSGSGQTISSPTSTAVGRTRSMARTSTTSSTCPRWCRSGLPRARARVDGTAGAELLSLLQGVNPDPLGADHELERLLAAVREDSAAAAVLDAAGEPGGARRIARTLPAEAGEAAGAYIDRVGYRPVNGEDVGEPCVIELPELIVGAIRSGLEAAESPSTESEVAERTAASATPFRESIAPRSTSCSRRRS